jgi:hypothetical protein
MITAAVDGDCPGVLGHAGLRAVAFPDFEGWNCVVSTVDTQFLNMICHVPTIDNMGLWGAMC